MSTFINNRRLAKLAGVNFDSEIIKPGPIVYSRTHLVTQQFTKLCRFPECILITSFSDACCTNEMARRLPDNVRMWFSNNVVTYNPRVTAVPIGIRTSPKGEELLRKAIDRGRLPERNLVYMNFWRKIPRPRNPRRGLYEMFGETPWITVEGGFDHVPMEYFYEQISSHPYILSPAGAGPDCHRHWESIILGSIPIVLKSSATKVLDGLPCLQVNVWSDVTEKRLIEEYPKLLERFKSNNMERVWFEYWKERILST